MERWWQTRKGRLTIACGIALAGAYGIGKLLPATEPWIFTLAMLVGLLPIARRAVMAALNGTPFSIEMLMTIAAAGAVFIGAAEEAAMVVFLCLIGELLEGIAAGKARASIEALTALVPKTALMEADGRMTEVPAESLPVGATILVRPGDRLAADGVILTGESGIDEAPVTGESAPVKKGPGDNAFAGTVNGDGALRLRVTAAAADNTIAGSSGWSRRRRRRRRRRSGSSTGSRAAIRRPSPSSRHSLRPYRRFSSAVRGRSGSTRGSRFC